MRICLVASSRILAPVKQGNPLYVQLHGLANALTMLGHTVDVIALPASAKESYNIYEICRFRLPGNNIISRAINEIYFGLATLIAIRRLARQNKLDIIHFDASVPAFITLLLTSKRHRPPTISWHGGPVPAATSGDEAQIFPDEWHEASAVTKVALALQSYVIHKTSKVIVLSNVLKDTIAKAFNVDPAKLTVIPPGVDSNLFRPDVDCSALREKYGISKDNSVIMCVAKIAPYKNQMALLKAIPQIVEKHPGARFIFAGPVSSSEYYSQIQDWVRTHSLDKYVSFTGSIINAELPRYHALSDIFVLTSIAEGLPGVLIEAMSCGKAAIASSIPQNREVAKKGDEVIFVDPYNTGAIAESSINLLSNHELRKEMGQKARQTVLEYFDWKVVAAQVAEVYKEALED